MTADDSDSVPLPPSVEEGISLHEMEAATPGAGAHAPIHFPPRAWWAILKRLYVMNDFHNLPLLSAGVAFFAFLAFVPLIAPFKCAKPLNQVPNCIVSAHTFIWSSDNDFPISGPTNDSSIARNPFIMNATCVFTIIAYHPTAVGGTNPKRHDTRH